MFEPTPRSLPTRHMAQAHPKGAGKRALPVSQEARDSNAVVLWTWRQQHDLSLGRPRPQDVLPTSEHDTFE